MSPRFLSMTLRSTAVAAAILLSACGGQETSAADAVAASADLRTPPTTKNFALVQADGNTAAPFATCTTSSGTVVVNNSTLAVTGSTFKVVFTGTENGAPAAYQTSGTVSTSGTTQTFKAAGTTFVGSTTNGVLTATGSACGAVHTLVFQQQ